MTKIQSWIVFILALAVLIGFSAWFLSEPGFEPAIGIFASLGGMAASFWPRFRKRKSYSKNRLSGRVSFDYSNNNGIYVIGNNDLFFETKWTSADSDSIHIYNDPDSIKTVSLAHGISSIGDIKDASIYDTSSRTRKPREGEIVILQNRQGNFAALHVHDVKSKNHGDKADEVTFTYMINEGGNASFRP